MPSTGLSELLVEDWPERRRRRMLADVVWPAEAAPTERELAPYVNTATSLVVAGLLVLFGYAVMRPVVGVRRRLGSIASSSLHGCMPKRTSATRRRSNRCLAHASCYNIYRIRQFLARSRPAAGWRRRG